MRWSTYASRPAWGLRARAITSAWVDVPVGIGALVALSLLLRTTELGIGFWIDEGLSVGIADRPLGDIPLALREDGSPPLYYMLLHFWLDIAGRSEAGVRGAEPAVRAAGDPGRLLGRAHDLGDEQGGLVRGRPDGLQPVPGAVRAGGADVLAGGAAGDPGHDLLHARPTRWTPNRRPWIAGFAVSVAVALYTHNWPIFFTVSAARGLGDAVVAGGQAAPPAAAARRPARLRRARVLYLPWVPTTLYQAAHTGAPWADAPAFSSLLGVPGVLLGNMPQIVLLICAGAGLVALLQRPLGERGRVAAVLIILAVLTPTIAWTLSQASPAWANRYLAVALPPFLLLAAGGLALRAPARRRRPACWW